ncbi:hypothetical protein BDW69DRAFT_176625 [Aspergillus filifer]
MAYDPESDIDQETADLILQLQLEDACLYFETSKGKSRERTDEEIAFQMQQEDLRNASNLAEDKRMAMSFYFAVQADGQAIANSEMEEKIAARDRELARNWRNDDQPVTTEEPQPDIDPDYLDNEILETLQALHMSGFCGYIEVDDTTSDNAESSACAAKQAPRKITPMHHCVACREETESYNILRAPCSHQYCRSCLEELFEAAINDESLFPPRCCRQPFVFNATRIFLKSDLVKRFEKKRIEFETPNRTYCYSPDCSAFIHPSNIHDNIATCPECLFTTCTFCKERAHTGDCPNDTAMQQLLETAQENGWQRCYSCWRVVELQHGCNHITCRCGAQFCYNCGGRWRTCECAEWNQHRLLARAYEIIDRDAIDPAVHALADAAQARPVPEPAAAVEPVRVLDDDDDDDEEEEEEEEEDINGRMGRMLQELVQELLENHECDHHQWRFIPGSHTCEECYHRLPQYIFECRQCRLRACWRCRRNRL